MCLLEWRIVSAGRLRISTKPIHSTLRTPPAMATGLAARIRAGGIEMPDNKSLHLHCPHCSGAVTVQFSDWNDGAAQVPTSYPCPWCGKGHVFESPGKFVWVTKGHEPQKPKRG